MLSLNQQSKANRDDRNRVGGIGECVGEGLSSEVHSAFQIFGLRFSSPQQVEHRIQQAEYRSLGNSVSNSRRDSPRWDRPGSCITALLDCDFSGFIQGRQHLKFEKHFRIPQQ